MTKMLLSKWRAISNHTYFWFCTSGSLWGSRGNHRL